MEKFLLINSDMSERNITLDELLQQSEKTILYFYPKDNTPGCAMEAKDFTENLARFESQGIQVVGVSKDSQSSHCNFISKQGLKIKLISDEDLTLHHKFGAFGEKNMYGKISQGTIRSTFLLDKTGKILKERRNVKATGHVEKIKKEI